MYKYFTTFIPFHFCVYLIADGCLSLHPRVQQLVFPCCSSKTSNTFFSLLQKLLLYYTSLLYCVIDRWLRLIKKFQEATETLPKAQQSGKQRKATTTFWRLNVKQEKKFGWMDGRTVDGWKEGRRGGRGQEKKVNEERSI